MAREPISFVTFCYNDGERLEKLLLTMKAALPSGSEIVVVDQSSTDGKTREIAEKHADVVLTRVRKGYPDPDRSWAYSHATNNWVFTLDTDELPDEKLLELIPRLADRGHGVNVYWLKRKNLVDGRDIFPILREDWQPRMFVKSEVRYTDRMHTHPEIASPLQMWVEEGCIVHTRTLAQIKKASEARRKVGDEEKQRVEQEFMKRLEAFLEGEGGDEARQA